MYIIGIDPGTNETGIAVLSISNDLTIDMVETSCLRPDGILPDSSYIDRCIVITNRIMQWIDYYRPKHITIETPFFYHRRPTAFGPLSELVGMVKYQCYNLDYNPAFHTLSPSEIKQVFGQSDADKDYIKNQLLSIPDIGSHIDIASVTDHETDAIAIAYVTWIMVRLCLWI